MTTFRETLTIVNERGLHARASAKFVNMVSDLPAGTAITVAKDGSEVAGGSILGLMMLGAAKGDTIEVAACGDEAEAALARLCALVCDGFGER